MHMGQQTTRKIQTRVFHAIAYLQQCYFRDVGSLKNSLHGLGKIGLRNGGGGGRWSPFSGPPPLLGSRDGDFKKVIDGGK